MIFYNERVITGCAMLQTYKSEALNSRSHRLSTFEKEKEELNPLFLNTKLYTSSILVPVTGLSSN